MPEKNVFTVKVKIERGEPQPMEKNPMVQKVHNRTARPYTITVRGDNLKDNVLATLIPESISVADQQAMIAASVCHVLTVSLAGVGGFFRTLEFLQVAATAMVAGELEQRKNDGGKE